MAEKGASFIPIEDFRPDYHDPDEWLGRFEKAVVLATNCSNDDRKKELYVAWLPMKLNDATRLMMSDALSAATAATWANLKTQFKSLLITPQDKYNWRSGRKRITWDGQENFHALAARVKRTIDRYEDGPSEADYYHEFRSALPRNYQQAIDLGHAAETLAEGKRIAFRVQAALAGGDDDAGTTSGKSVAFVGGSMTEESRQENRLKTMEMGLQGMSIKVDNLCAEVAKTAKEAKVREERARSPTPPRGDQYRQRSGDAGSNEVDPRRRSSPDGRYDRYDSRERYKPRHQDDDRFDNDDYSYSLGQGQCGAGVQETTHHRTTTAVMEGLVLSPRDHSVDGVRSRITAAAEEAAQTVEGVTAQDRTGGTAPMGVAAKDHMAKGHTAKGHMAEGHTAIRGMPGAAAPKDGPLRQHPVPLKGIKAR